MSLQRKGFMHQGCIKNAAPLRGLRGTEPCQRTLGEWATDKTLGRAAGLRGGWYAAAPDYQFDRLVTRYRARYGKTPYRLASLGYDSVLLAVRSAKSWPIGRAFPARTLVDKDGFAGVDGNFRFSRDGIAERLLEVRSVTATGSAVVSPAATAF